MTYSLNIKLLKLLLCNSHRALSVLGVLGFKARAYPATMDASPATVTRSAKAECDVTHIL